MANKNQATDAAVMRALQYINDNATGNELVDRTFDNSIISMGGMVKTLDGAAEIGVDKEILNCMSKAISSWRDICMVLYEVIMEENDEL